jgi:hypothetical protein
MAFDTATRNELQKLVGRVRDLLVKELTGQCQTLYGIQPDGTALALDKLGHRPEDEQTLARLLRERIDHLAAGLAGAKRRAEAFDRLVREQAFTVLNRLCALRMCEERGLVQECVRHGMASKGFQLFEKSGAALGGDTFGRYRLYLDLLFDELAVELGVLFDRFAPTGLLFPGETALKVLLEQINVQTLARIWAEDEAIGWVYQYFNSQEERQAMRKASSAPRNSRELAIRNQFFTPRYVVEFLIDNSLGRLWYEMRQGGTALAESCGYLVRRPDEVFLARDDAPRTEAGSTIVPFRARKDPRDLRILDPACGSGHFLLYAFDLLLVIYREAWLESSADADSPRSEITGTTLAEDYGSEAEFERAIPELILHHNLHGIDIDPRAAQIAALALWLRAQRAWQDQRLKPADRPSVLRTNIVCAEPMPGEQETLTDFAGQLRPPVLGQLLQVVFERMRLAGEAGCLLRVEEEIRTAVETARAQWQEGGRPEQIELFPELAGPRQQRLRFDLSGVTRDAFWDQAEGRILDGLRRYAEEADVGVDMGRRMFADDTAAGFAFIDLCRQRFDVVVMNPPFGAASTRSKDYITKNYPRSKNDLLAACVERGIGWLHPGGLLGAITSRTAFFLTSFRHWRQGVVLGDASPVVMADLGHGVMDAAMVEAAAYVLRKR